MDFVRNNLLLIVVAVVSGAMLIWPLLRRTTGGPWVDASGATQLINREDALVALMRGRLSLSGPVTAETPAGHVIHTERYAVPAATMRAISKAWLEASVTPE